MNASRCLSLRIIGMCLPLVTPLLLTQCSMPPRQAWHYIQTRGLLNYWQYASQHASPPFRSGLSHSAPRYATTNRSLNVPRHDYRPSSTWSPLQDYGRAPYGYSQNRYYEQGPAPMRSSNTYDPPPSRPQSDGRPPRITMPVEEPAAAPQIANTPKPEPDVASKTNTLPPPSPAKPATDLPYGTPVPGRDNMVNSPFADKTQLVDVSGMGPGQVVKCPYTGKLFKVPAAQQAENKAESRQESKIEPQNFSSEPRSGDKKP